MAAQQPPELWEPSRSLANFDIKARPVLSDISMVIPTLGRDILEQCLYHILMGSAWPGELLIVNQGPSEKVEGWLAHARSLGLSARQICSDQRGRSAGINRGLEQVSTTLVAITDDDCFVAVDWLETMHARLAQNFGAVVTGRVEAAGEDMIVTVTSMVPAQRSKPRLMFDSMSGGNMGTSISVFKQVGLFDEDPCMQTAEDAEWAYRALRKRVTIRYEPDIYLWHYGWRDPAKRAVQYRHYALSHGGFYGKYLRKGDVFILARAVLHLLRALRRWVTGKRAGDFDTALLGRAYTLYLLPGILGGLKSQRKPGRL